VPSLLERFHRRYPQVAIDFTQAGSYDLLAKVRAGAMDVAFVASSDHLGTLTRSPIATRPVVLLTPPEHPLASSGRVDWADLDDEDFVDFDPSWAVRGLNDRAAAAHGVRRRVRCTVNDIHTLLDLLHRGLGVALVPLPISAKPQAVGLATVRLPAGETPQWEVSAVTGTGSSPAPQLLELLDAATPAVPLPEPALA
jgi:DNA-binding transcriptional LysR family regulator